MKRFYSRVDWVLAAIVWLPIIACWILCIPLIIGSFSTAMVIVNVTLASSTILLASIYTSTYYTIDAQHLHWRTGPFKGKIEIKNILSIDRYDSMFGISAVMKPALARNPLKIKYAKYDDMPFSPADEKGFIEELMKVNNTIEINASDQIEAPIAS